MTNISALKNLYTSLGGSLTDSYDDIADGAKVGDYSQIADGICACAKVSNSATNTRFTGVCDTTTTSSGSWTHCALNCEYSQIADALNSGKHVDITMTDKNPIAEGLTYVFTISLWDNNGLLMHCIWGGQGIGNAICYAAQVTDENISDFNVKMYTL